MEQQHGQKVNYYATNYYCAHSFRTEQTDEDLYDFYIPIGRVMTLKILGQHVINSFSSWWV